MEKGLLAVSSKRNKSRTRLIMRKAMQRTSKMQKANLKMEKSWSRFLKRETVTMRRQMCLPSTLTPWPI
jgi:hypothetical protein